MAFSELRIAEVLSAAGSAALHDASALTFKEMYGQFWEDAMGKTLFELASEDVLPTHGKICRACFTNFGGLFRALVRFADGRCAEFPSGFSSPLMAVR